MIINQNFLNLLCCPKRLCHGDLEEIKKDEVYILRCKSCQAEYKIINNIPILLSNIDYSLDINKRYLDQKAVITDYVRKYGVTGKIILECGCGDARLLSDFPEAEIRIGIDTSLIFLQTAKKREPNFFLVCGQFENMPFKDCIADFSVSISLFQNTKTPERAFAEMVRAVKPSGYVALEVNNRLNLIEKWFNINFIKFQRYVGVARGINFFSMKKVCFIGSIQAGIGKRPLFKKVSDRLKRMRSEKAAIKFEKKFENRNHSFVSSDENHLRATIGWLKKAQDATVDGGVSRGWDFIGSGKSNAEGWQPSYPETTGYIIPTMIESAKLLGDKDLLRRAKLMADWELQIMFPDGAVHGGNIAQKSSKAIFDTGQVIRGLLAIYDETKDEKYLKTAQKSARWMLESEYNKEGRWIENNAACVNPHSTTYNTFAIAPLAELGKIINNKELLELGKRVGHFALKMQNSNGWFNGADFSSRPDALLHTIAYTIDGLWDLGEILNEEEFLKAAKRALGGVLSQMDEQGKISGRLNSLWKGDVDWCCLTGIAQIGVTCMKVFKKDKEAKYFEVAKKAKEFLKTCQNNLDDSYGGGKGAVWGSWPISGGYEKYQALDWAAKFFADLLIVFLYSDSKK